jgi:hypothetical protein
VRGEGLPVTQAIEFAEERQPAGCMGIGEPRQEEPPEQAGQDAHRHQEAGSASHPACAVERDPAARDDHVQMRMVGHRRAPGVEHGSGTDAGAEVLGIGRDGEQRLGRRLEQRVVDHRHVLVGDRGDLGRQGEDQVEVADRQQIGLAGGEPVLRRRALALGTMAVAARVVGDPAVAAILAVLDMTAEGCRAAAFDGRHHLELAEAHMPGIGSAPGGRMVMEDVCDLQLRAAHRRRARLRVSASLRAAAQAGRAGWSRCGSWCWRRGCRGPWCRAWRGRAAPPPSRGQALDDADVGVLFQQVGGEAVPQRVRRHPLLVPGDLGGGMDGTVELTGRQRLDRAATPLPCTPSSRAPR